MSCTLQIDAAILRFAIPYKYVIYSPKMEHKDDCYEYCRAYSSNPNRCVCISQAEYKQAYGGICYLWYLIYIYLKSCISAVFIFAFIGTYHQYDNVAYPKTVKTSDTSVQPKDIKTSKTFLQSFKALFRSRSVAQPQEEEEILSPLEMGKLCLQVYLDGYKRMLCSGSFPQQANLKMIVEEIFHIFHLLYCPIICHQNSSQPVTQCLGGKFTEVRSFHSISQLTAIDKEDFFTFR